MNRVGLLTHWLSRRGGGVFDAVGGLGSAMYAGPLRDVQFFGLADSDTETDVGRWANASCHPCRVYGPKAFGYAPDLLQVLHRASLDLLHTHGLFLYPSVASSEWARSTGRPLVVSPHGMLDPWALRNSAWKKQLALGLIERRHLRRAACLHALCDAEADSIRRLGFNNPVAVVPNAVHLPVDTEDADSAPWEGRLPGDALVLLYLGRIHPKKNLSVLLRAWTKRMAPERDDRWWLVVAGWDQGGYEVELRRDLDQNGRDRVLFVGPQFGASKAASFRRADAFVLPSLSEGLPMVVLEAWSYRLPVLMTHHCNLPEGFGAGAAIETGTDVAAVAEGLAALTGLGEASLRAMGDHGRSLVEARFTWPRVTEAMVSVYRWVLREGPQPAVVRESV